MMRYFFLIDNDDPDKDSKLAKIKAYCEEIGVKSGETKLTNAKRTKEIDLVKLRQLLDQRFTYSAMAKELNITKSLLLRRAIEALVGISSSNGETKEPAWVEIVEE